MNEDIAGFDDVTLSDLRRRTSYKWRFHPEDVLPAFVAEMDFPLAPPVAQALHQMVTNSDCGYAWPSEELSAALAAFTMKRWSWSMDPSQVTLVADVMCGVLEMLRLVLKPGDGVIINTPVYPPFFEHIGEAGCRVVEAPLARMHDGSYRLDLDAVDRAFAAGARAYLLCNPHNPSGQVPSREELQQIAAMADRYDALIISDEIHAPLVLPGATHTPYLSLGTAASERGVALLSASKAWNVPGLKCAQLIAISDRMQAHVRRLGEAVTFRTGMAGIAAGIAAYREGGPWLDQLLRVIERNGRLVGEFLHELVPQARYAPPQASYLAWIDCSALNIDGDPAQFFLERGRVALYSGLHFGRAGAGQVRLTMGTSRDILRSIVERMAAALR